MADYIYNVPRVVLPMAPDVKSLVMSKINGILNVSEGAALKSTITPTLPPQVRLVGSINLKKEDLKKTLIPFVIALLAKFGPTVLQAIITELPLDQLKDLIACPAQKEVLSIINKRNKLAKQINNVYQTVTITSKTLAGVNIAIAAIQVGIAAAAIIPYPLPPGVPIAIGILKDQLKNAQVVVSVLTITLASFGVILGLILKLLKSLDLLVQQCAQDQNIPFEIINNELNLLVNQSTGLSNSAVIATVQNNTYKEFTLEIKLDETNQTQYPKRYAQALNKTGTPVLKTDSSFASDPQVLIDQLKFIIDSNPNLTAE
jgi:antitoxin component of RelBE/YafQ-DinJ toxin-antitoxin module